MKMKTKADPTGQAKRRNKSTKRLQRRLSNAEKKVKRLFRAIPKKRRTKVQIRNLTSETRVIYDYEFTAQEMELLGISIERILNEELLETQTDNLPPDWYWEDDVEPPYRQGTLEETNTFNQAIITAGIVGITIAGIPIAQLAVEQVLFSEPYRTALNQLYVRNFSTIKGLSERTSSQLIQILDNMIQAGNTPTEIINAITERFNVSKSSAERIAQTEINRAYNDAKLETGINIAKQTGLRAGVIHISALTSTTRTSHAARHGNAYTVEDQLAWWNEGANRINCKCTTQTVLIDGTGKVVEKEFQDKIKREKKFFKNP